MPTPSRELSITYGAYSVSPDSHFRLEETFESFTLDFNFVVTAASEALFAAACSAARTAFRKPFQSLTIAQGATSQVFSMSSTANTGLETKSVITKEEQVADTGRSRRFHIRITGGQPADNAPTVGLREYSVSVGYTPARRRLVTLSGVWTAGGSSAARAAYTAAIDNVAATLKTSLGITDWELVAEDPTANSYNDQTLSWSRQYREIKFGQGSAGGDDASLVEQQLRISVSKSSEMMGVNGGFPEVSGTSAPNPSNAVQAFPFIRITGSYEVWVNFSSGMDLVAKWGTLRNWVRSVMQAATQGTSGFAVVSEEASYFKDDNRISATMTGIAAPATGLLRREYSQNVSIEAGMKLTPAWTGSKFSKYAYQGPGRYIVTTRLLEEAVSGGNAAAGGASALGSESISFEPAPGPTVGGSLKSAAASSPPQNRAASAAPPAVPELTDPVPDNPAAAAGDAGPAEVALISDSPSTETMVIGFDSPFTIVRTTRVQVVERFSAIRQPVGYGDRT